MRLRKGVSSRLCKHISLSVSVSSCFSFSFLFLFLVMCFNMFFSSFLFLALFYHDFPFAFLFLLLDLQFILFFSSFSVSFGSVSHFAKHAPLTEACFSVYLMPSPPLLSPPTTTAPEATQSKQTCYSKHSVSLHETGTAFMLLLEKIAKENENGIIYGGGGEIGPRVCAESLVLFQF